MTFNKYKRIFVIIGILSMLIPSVFLTKPQKAEAVVPVLDSMHSAISEMGWFQDEAKEYGFDALAWIVAKVAIEALTNSIVNWIKTGSWDGSALFITSMDQIVDDAIYEATGIFINDYLDPSIRDLLCEPWYEQIYRDLLQHRSRLLDPRNRFYDCTLDDIINNIEGMNNFTTDFRNGGWEAWLSLFDQPTNNPYGAYLHNKWEMDAIVAEKTSQADTEAQMNQGFKGDKTCEIWAPNVEGVCLRWTTHSPGSWIEDQLAEHTATEIRTLEMADEIDEVLGALAQMLINWAFTGITGDRGGTPPGPPTMPPPPPSTIDIQRLRNDINQAILNETAYRDTVQSIIGAYQTAISTFQSALICFTTYSGEEDVTTNIDYINGQIDNVSNNLLPPWNDELSASNAIISEFQDLRARITTVRTEEELQILRDEYNVLMTQAHNALDQSRAEQQFQEIQDTIALDAQTQLSICSQLPPPPTGPPPTEPPPPEPPPVEPPPTEPPPVEPPPTEPEIPNRMPMIIYIGDDLENSFCVNEPQTFQALGADQNTPRDPIRYGFDWDLDYEVDDWDPESGYIASGSAGEISHTWEGAGTFLFQAMVEDSRSLGSNWLTHEITIIYCD